MKAGIEFTHNGTDYVFRAENISRMKAQLCPDFERTFFDRRTRRFHGDIKHYWSASRQVLVITRKDSRGKVEKIEYALEGNELGKLSLRLV